MADLQQGGVSGRRREQAERTRVRILDAAYRLFCADGYEPTTMQAVAEAAGVAVQTVYLNFRTKARLLSEVEARVVLGDQPAERWREQPWARAIAEERDPERLLAIFVRADTSIKSRIGPFLAAVGPALSQDPGLVTERERGRDGFFGSVIERLAALDALRPGLTPDRALDIVRAVNSTEAYTELTMRRGWTADEWEEWLFDTLTHQLLGASTKL